MDDIERLARLMCAEIGVSPDKMITVGSRKNGWFGVTYITAPRWETFKGVANDALAMDRAMTKFKQGKDK